MNYPKEIQAFLGDETYTRDTVGMSNSSVMVFDDKVLKVQKSSDESKHEYQVMQWLQGRLPVPKVLAYAQEKDHDFLLMSKLPGEMACSETLLQQPERLTELLANALQLLWQVDTAPCPFTVSLEQRLSVAALAVEQGHVHVDHCEPDTFGPEGFRDVHELLAWLQANKPEQELVFTHGDFCLPNIFFHEGQVAGFIDLGKAGIADQWQDIALCYRSLLHNYSGKYSGKEIPGFRPEMLFDQLGIEPNWEKIRYYILLDELF